jgi:hypothetical protein
MILHPITIGCICDDVEMLNKSFLDVLFARGLLREFNTGTADWTCAPIMGSGLLGLVEHSDFDLAGA